MEFSVLDAGSAEPWRSRRPEGLPYAERVVVATITEWTANSRRAWERPVRSLSSFIIVSLDGFHEDAKGVFDFAIVDEEFREFAIRHLDESDSLGFGRATYEHMAA